jgi:2-dehydro-3-deoxy-D-arabinonate dehydratase
MKIAVIRNSQHPHLLTLHRDEKFFTIPSITTLTDALHLSLFDFRKSIESNSGIPVTGELVAPISSEIELWGAGVTYLRSRDARKEESDVPDVYQRVYEADRPELFFKGNSRRTRGTGADIGIRYDSIALVPERRSSHFYKSL